MKIPSWLQKIIDKIKLWINNNTTTTTTTPSGTTTTTTTPSDSGNPTGKLKGYGMVNMWLTLSSSAMESMFKSLKDNGCNMTSIELFGREEDGWINDQNKVKSQFDTFIKLARSYHINVFVDIVNWGSTSLTSKDDAWFQGYLDFLKGYGPSNLIVQACGEGSGEKATRWYSMMENTLTGFSLSYNMGSRPTTASSRYQYIDYHLASMSDMSPTDSRIIFNTDSGILNEMMNGGVLGQTFITDKVIQFATPLKSRSVNLYGYYHKTCDTNAIKTLCSVK
jgi:hypothetical protein